MLQIFQHNNHIKAMENTKFPPKNICSNCKKFFRFSHCMVPEVGWDKGILHSPSKPGDSRDSFWEGLVNYIFKHFLLGGQGRFGTKPNFFLKIFKLIPYTFNMSKIFYHTARGRMKRRELIASGVIPVQSKTSTANYRHKTLQKPWCCFEKVK